VSAAESRAAAPIALWAVPRSRSTAFLRIMLERGDLNVVHEPFSYFVEDGQFDVADRRATSMPGLLELLLAANGTGKRVFFKDTSDYRYPSLLADDRLYHQVINTFMIREPQAAIASHHAMNPHATLDEIGFEYLHTIFEAVWAETGEIPLVIDGDDLVADPEGVVRAYCDRVGLPFIGSALHWQPGKPDAKSAWQRTARWHQEVDDSSGLVATARRPRLDIDSDPRLLSMVEHHRPFYDIMYGHRLAPSPAAE
jgi:hypothetical protein